MRDSNNPNVYCCGHKLVCTIFFFACMKDISVVLAACFEPKENIRLLRNYEHYLGPQGSNYPASRPSLCWILFRQNAIWVARLDNYSGVHSAGNRAEALQQSEIAVLPFFLFFMAVDLSKVESHGKVRTKRG